MGIPVDFSSFSSLDEPSLCLRDRGTRAPDERLLLRWLGDLAAALHLHVHLRTVDEADRLRRPLAAAGLAKPKASLSDFASLSKAESISHFFLPAGGPHSIANPLFAPIQNTRESIQNTSATNLTNENGFGYRYG